MADLITIDRAVAEQALEALDKLYLPGELERVNAAITALRAELAQAEPVEHEYGSTDCATFAGLPMTDGDRRLAAMLTQAVGTNHPAINDLVALLFAARGKQQAEPVQFDPEEAMRLADEYAEAAHQFHHRVDEARAKLASYLGIKGGENE